MPGGKLTKKPSKGKGQPKRKNPSRPKRKAPGEYGSGTSTSTWRDNSPQKQVGAAAAYATQQVGKAPRVQATRDTCNVQHREFIGNIVGTTVFGIASTFAINPGLSASFPWLAGIAQNWETYRFKRLRFCYYTRTGSNIPGSVILAHDPDSSDAQPATEQIMTTYEAVKEDAPWKDICLVLRPSSLHEGQQRKFVRTGPLAANEDIKLYDSGNLFIGTVDGTAVNWGKLWLEYDVEFQTPQLPPAGLANNGVGTMTTAAGTVASPLAAGIPLGPIAISQALTVVTMTNLVVGQEYLCTYVDNGVDNVTVNFGTYTGCTLKNTLPGGPNNYCLNATVTATAVTASLVITVSGASGVALFSVSQMPAGLAL